jgi:pyruvate ferredoxin oxidoreductase gamma subunit
MYRIRFHGRGGQGIKTASRLLGTALFRSGYEVQDAPRYGAERRGAPIFAYVRADRAPIRERGIIRRPDLVVVADDTLVPVPAAGVLAGLTIHTTLLIRSEVEAETWRERLNVKGPLIVLEQDTQEDSAGLPYVGAFCAGAAARLLGIVSEEILADAIREEQEIHSAAVVRQNLDLALAAFAAMAGHAGCVAEGAEISPTDYNTPEWVQLPVEDARVSAPVIHAALTSELQRTGLWRTLRPVIDYERCNRCWWVCGGFCPDGAISVRKGVPEIDYDHCKGCLVCVVQCPPHAIEAQPEHAAEVNS